MTRGLTAGGEPGGDGQAADPVLLDDAGDGSGAGHPTVKSCMGATKTLVEREPALIQRNTSQGRLLEEQHALSLEDSRPQARAEFLKGLKRMELRVPQLESCVRKRGTSGFPTLSRLKRGTLES